MKSVFLNEIKNITRCVSVDVNPPDFPSKPHFPPIAKHAIQTEGVNLQAMWNHADVFDINRILSNDIHAILQTYGVEAACASIKREISGVFKVYGITVNPRHLSVIADLMT